MKKSLKNLLLIAGIWFVTTPGIVVAQTDPTGILGAKKENITTNSLVGIIFSLAEWFLIFIGVVAVIIVLWSAFQFITGSGNEDRVEKAKKTLIWALVGVAVAIVSFSIVRFVESLFF